MSEPRLYKVRVDHPDLGTERTVVVQARTTVQTHDAAAKVMKPGERIIDVEPVEGPVAQHHPVPPDAPFPGTQTHPDDRGA